MINQLIAIKSCNQ